MCGGEALHTDDLAVTAGSALRRLFIKPLKEHNHVICVSDCFSSLCALLFGGREKKQNTRQ